jgi:hypothetical protein
MIGKKKSKVRCCGSWLLWLWLAKQKLLKTQFLFPAARGSGLYLSLYKAKNY